MAEDESEVSCAWKLTPLLARDTKNRKFWSVAPGASFEQTKSSTQLRRTLLRMNDAGSSSPAESAWWIESKALVPRLQCQAAAMQLTGYSSDKPALRAVDTVK